MKTEPDECSIDDALAAPGRITPWTGVRNYQARNFMLNDMEIGDGVLFYHSSCPEPGIAGLAEVASAAYPDETQFDPKSDKPRWFHVDVRALQKTALLPLAAMKAQKQLKKMVTLRPGNRLSITPVTHAEWKHITSKLL